MRSNIKTNDISSLDAIHSHYNDTDYMAMMCHEIGTPLTAILGISHILLNMECSPQKKSECAEALRDSSNMLMELMNNMRDASKIDNNRIELEYIPFDLTKILEEVKNIAAVRAIDKGLSIHTRIGKKMPALFMGDPLRIRQILLNLLGNAVKFSSKGVISLYMTEESVSDELSHVSITVADCGIGIKKEQLEEIFGKYAQANADIVRTYGGTGLGLFISQELAHLMNGSITVKSWPGEGSHFTVTLPLQKATALLRREYTEAS